jgi:bla regulator protein BlaR1
MKSLVTIIPDNVVNALGWTIFHSLWQGLIIGLILLMIFKFRPNISSQARYVLGVLALAAIFFSSLFTFHVANDPILSHADFITYSPGGISLVADISETTDKLSVGPRVLSGWQQRLTGTFDFVSIIWFVGVLLLTMRLAGGMMVVRGMRRLEVLAMPA